MIRSFILLLVSCTATLAADVITYPAPEGSPRSEDFIVKVNGQRIDLYGSRTRYASTATFGYFDFTGEVELEITTANPAPHTTEWQIIPESYHVEHTQVKNGTIRCTIHQPMNLTFVVVGDYWGNTLHLFAGMPMHETPTAEDTNVIYFGPGYHEIGKDHNYTIHLKDNQTLYLAGGAYVKAFVEADSAKNIKITGRGILGQFADMPRTRSITLTNCDGVDINGIITNRNRDGWSGVIINSENIHIHDYKVVSPPIWSTDGMNLVNSSNAHYSNCFFRAADDNIAIKGMGASGKGRNNDEDPNTGKPNENILVENCIFWSDNNNGVVIGQETKASYYKNITFRNCDFLFVRDEEPIKAAMAIICNNGTYFNEITFDNIRVGPSGQLITMFFCEEIFQIPGNQKWPGQMKNITFSNIDATGSGSKIIRLNGWGNQKTIDSVLLKNISINGENITNDSRYLKTNSFVTNLLIE